MYGFETRNSRYLYDGDRMLTGEKLGNGKKKFRTLRCFVSVPAVIDFEDGTHLETSEVVRVLGAHSGFAKELEKKEDKK